MSFKTNDTVIYRDKEYMIVGHAASMSIESFYVIKIKDGSDNQEITVSEKKLTKPSNNTTQGTLLNTSALNTSALNASTPEKSFKPDSNIEEIDPNSIGSAVKKMDLKCDNYSERTSIIQNRLDGETLPQLLSKAEYDTYKREYDNYKQNKQLKKIADPGKCFTNYGVENTTLRDALRSRDVMYDWREKEAMFGISGELSLFGLLEFALMTTNIIVETEELGSDEKKIISSSEGVVDGFIDSYNTYLNEDFSNRKSLDDPIVKVVTTYILKVLEEIKTNYKTYKTLYEVVSANFCAASYKLIVQIILTKSGLDPLQYCGAKEVVSENNFCVFSTYDASAALNTPIGPIMTSSIFEGASVSQSQTAYIIDDKCVISILYLYKTPIERRKVIGLGTFLDTVFIMLRHLDDTERKNDLVNGVEPNIGYNSSLTREFIKCMDNIISETIEETDPNTRQKVYKTVEKTMYKKLYDLEISDSELIRCNKYVYEFISKLLLNYNVSKGKLDPISITSESRDIRAHDYANSPIRYFGVYIYIIKRICDWLSYNKGIVLDISSIEIDDQVMKVIDTLEEKDTESLTEFIIEKESLEFRKKFKNVLCKQEKDNKENTNTISRKTRRSTSTSGRTDSGRTEISSFTIQSDEKYLSFLNDIHYIPSIFTTDNKKYDFLKIIYQQMCIQNSDNFEGGQSIVLRNKTIVHSVTDTGFDNPDRRVILTCGPIFEKNKDNTPIVQMLINKGITHDTGYILDDETFGIVDLSLKNYGPNNTANAFLVHSVFSEADAAEARITCYTNEVNSHIDGELYYNGIRCAEVYSGYYEEKYQNQIVDICRNIETDIKLARYILLDAHLDTRYKNLKKETAPNILQAVKSYIENTNTEFREINEELGSFLTKLNDINIQGKTAVAEKYDNALKPIVSVFTANLSTLYKLCIQNNYQNDPEKCRKMSKEIGQILENLYEILGGTIKSTKKSGGGNSSSCFGSSCISTNQVAPDESLPSGESEDESPSLGESEDISQVFGQYITVENGIFVTKLIKSEEELKRLKEYYGYTKEQEDFDDVDGEDFDDVDNREVESITDGSNEEARNPLSRLDATSPLTLPKPNPNAAEETKHPDLNNVGTPISANVGGKKTKKHKKPKKKKTTKKNVKRQTKHNKTTKRKKTTKRPAKRTRRRRYHSKH